MKRLALALAATLLGVSVAWSLQDTKDPPKKDTPKKAAPVVRQPAKLTPAGEEYRDLQAELRKAQSELLPAYREAKTPEEKEKALDNYYKAAEPFAPRFIEFAKKHEKDPTAFQALIFVISNGNEGAAVNEAIEILLKDHSSQIATAARSVARGRGKGPEQFLRTALAKSTDVKVQAAACLGLGQLLKGQAEKAVKNSAAEAEKLNAEAESQLNQVAQKLAEFKTILDQADSSLFEIRNLSVGKTIPDLEADDTDGKKFKLSDYRGKVVLIDFWAHW